MTRLGKTKTSPGSNGCQIFEITNSPTRTIAKSTQGYTCLRTVRRGRGNFFHIAYKTFMAHNSNVLHRLIYNTHLLQPSMPNHIIYQRRKKKILMTVNIYLDVDGVIGATSLGKPAWGWPDHIHYKDQHIDIRYSPSLVYQLNYLNRLPQVKPRWLTTWDEKAAEYLSPHIGLNGQHWGVVGTKQHYDKTIKGWWKLDAIREHTQKYTKPDDINIWIDDDIAADVEAMEWVRENPNVRAISPNSYVGLTRAETIGLIQYVNDIVHDNPQFR